jgi:hypothetical protein
LRIFLHGLAGGCRLLHTVNSHPRDASPRL